MAGLFNLGAIGASETGPLKIFERTALPQRGQQTLEPIHELLRRIALLRGVAPHGDRPRRVIAATPDHMQVELRERLQLPDHLLSPTQILPELGG